MAEHQRTNRENTEEVEGKSYRKKKAYQPLHDQLKDQDEGVVNFVAEPSLERHAALLADVHSDEQRANLVAQLQKSYGNAYVQRLLKSRTVRARLTVSQPDDDSEREADRVANIVMQTSAYPIQRQEEEEEEELQMKVASQVQRQEEEEEEELQMKVASQVQRQEEEEEEELQMKVASQVQRQEEEEEEELQMKVASQVQRQEEEEEEELQMKVASQVQRQEEEEEKELQMKVASQVQRQEEEEEEELQMKVASQVQRQEEAAVQTKAVEAQLAAASEDLETRINAARGGGQPLDDSVRASLEPQFGHDFGEVKVHTDAEANRLSQQLGAEAFTTGRDIFFREGAYQPGSDSGKGLIAHELTHVVQQEGGTTAHIRQKAVEQSRDESTGIVQRVNGANLVGWNTQTISASNGYIHHQVGWNSSTDNLADLAHIRTREQISWPACPWPVMGMDAAYSAPGQHHGLTTTPATSGGNKDDHEAIRPYPDFSQLPTLLAKGQQTASFVMNQVYQYSSDGGTIWHNIPGSQYTLTRILRRKKYRGNRYVFTLTKQGVTDADVNHTTTKTVKM